MDFIGNPLNGVLGCWDLLQEELTMERRKRMQKGLNNSWNEFFQRVETFRNSGFESVGEITIENLDKLLVYKDKGPLKPGLIEEVDNLYRSTIDHS